jgi:uncharacterized protein YoxC
MQNLESESTPEISNNETTHEERAKDKSEVISETLKSLSELWDKIPADDDKFLNDVRGMAEELPKSQTKVAREFLEFVDKKETKIRSVNTVMPGVSKKNTDYCRDELLKKVTGSTDQKDVFVYGKEFLARTKIISDDMHSNRKKVDSKFKEIAGVGYVKFGYEKGGTTEQLERLTKQKVQRDEKFLQIIDSNISLINSSVGYLAEERLHKLGRPESKPE